MRALPLVVLLMAACRPADDPPGGQPGSFVESFDAADRIDDAQTTARWEPGRVLGDVVDLADAGTGGDGALATTEDGALPAGVLQLTEATIAHALTVDGDLTLLVQGALVVEGTGGLTVTGDLTLVAAGPVRLEGTLDVTDGDLVVQQPTDAGVALDGATVRTRSGGAVGSITIATRGGLSVGSSLVETSRATEGSPGGDVLVRAYGDVTLDATSFVEAWGGRVDVRTEGSVSVLGSSFLGDDQAPSTTVRAGGDLTVSGTSFLASAQLDVVAQGTMRVVDRSFVECDGAPEEPCAVWVTVGALILEDRGWIQGGGNSEGDGGDVTVEVVGDLTSTDGWIEGGWTEGGNGGSATVRVGGDVTLTGTGGIHGGYDDGGGAAGGDVVVEIGGTLTTADEAAIAGGEGTPEGSRTVVEGAAVSVVADAEVLGRATVTSVGLPLPGDATITGGSTTTEGLDTEDVVLLVSPTGAEEDFAPLDTLAGASLAAGWRYRARIPHRLFDTAVLEEIRVDYETAD